MSPATTAAQRDLSKRAVAWVERSCAEQGVPVKMTDPFVLAEVAGILCSVREKRDRQAEPVLRVTPERSALRVPGAC